VIMNYAFSNNKLSFPLLLPHSNPLNLEGLFELLALV
jgi:hypothetical protein